MLKIAFVSFERISGLSVNLAKSELVIAKDVDTLCQELAAHMGCVLGTFPLMYLGLPLSNKKLNRSAYLPLLNKFTNRLSGWAAKHLSITG